MPRSQADADVLVYGGAVETAALSGDGGATVTEFGEYQSFVDREHAEVDAAIDRILGSVRTWSSPPATSSLAPGNDWPERT